MDRSNVKTRPATGNMANIVARHNQRRSPKKDSNEAGIQESPSASPTLPPLPVGNSNSIEGFEDSSGTVRGQSVGDNVDVPEAEGAPKFEDSSGTVRGQQAKDNLGVSEADATHKFEDSSRTIQGQFTNAVELPETPSSLIVQDESSVLEDSSGTVRGQSFEKEIELIPGDNANPVAAFEDGSGTVRGQPAQKAPGIDTADTPNPVVGFEDGSGTVRGQPAQKAPGIDTANIPNPVVGFEDGSGTVRGQPLEKTPRLVPLVNSNPVTKFEDSSGTVRGQPAQKALGVDNPNPVVEFEDSSGTIRGQATRTSVNRAGATRGVGDNDYWSRSDLSKKILKAVGAHCDEKLARISRPLTHKYIATLVDSTVESVKKTLQRLEKSGCLLRIKAKSGPQGWTVYQMPLTIFVEVQNDRDALKATE